MIANFLFYNQTLGIQNWLTFSDMLKHVDVITDDGKILSHFRLDKKGIHHVAVKYKYQRCILKSLLYTSKNLTRMIRVEIKYRAPIDWQPWILGSCNETCRWLTGIDIGFTFNPGHLYSKLLKYDNVTNYVILDVWRR